MPKNNSQLLDKKEERYKVDNKHVYKINNKKINFVFFLLIFSSILVNLSNGSYENIQSKLKQEFSIENDIIKGLMTFTFAIGTVIGKKITYKKYLIYKLIFIFKPAV